MFNGLSIHWMALPTLSNVCRTSRYLSPFVSKAATEVAVVYDPMRNELFTATRGQGAQLNGYRSARQHRSRSRRYYSGDRLPVQSKTVRHYLHQHRRQTVLTNVQTSVVPVLRRWIWLTSLRVVLTVSLKSVCARGISRQASCWFVKQAASSATSPVVTTIC